MLINLPRFCLSPCKNLYRSDIVHQVSLIYFIRFQLNTVILKGDLSGSEESVALQLPSSDATSHATAKSGFGYLYFARNKPDFRASNGRPLCHSGIQPQYSRKIKYYIQKEGLGKQFTSDLNCWLWELNTV